jgi:hypothetical protein
MTACTSTNIEHKVAIGIGRRNAIARQKVTEDFDFIVNTFVMLKHLRFINKNNFNEYRTY